MYKIEMHNLIRQILQSFYRLGLWGSSDRTSCSEFGRKLFHCLYMLSFFASLVAAAYVSNDNAETIYNLAIAIANFLEVFRLLKLICGKNSIVAFLKCLSCHSTSDSKEFDLINQKIKLFARFARCVIFFVTFAFAFAMILPVVLQQKILVFNVAVPLNWTSSSFLYLISRAFVLGGCFYGGFSMSISIIIWYLMVNCSIKYEVLGNQLRRLGVKNDSETIKLQTVETQVKISEKEKQKIYLKDLIEAIKTHRNINRMVDQFSIYFEDVFFIQIGTSGMCICGAIFSIIFNSNKSVLYHAIYCVFIIYSFLDIFVVMLLGHKIKESSEKLCYYLFESDWYGQSKECKKCIIIMAEILKRPQEIIICKLYALNLETFTSILNGAYSMFNILTNMK